MSTSVYDDLRDSLHRWRFWLLFGTHDADAQFQRTAIGGFFHTLHMLLRVGIIYLVFKDALGGNDPHYFGYVAIGLPLFVLYSSAITNGYSILKRNKNILTSMPMPYFAFIFRFLVEQSIKFGFSLIPFGVYLLFHLNMLEGTLGYLVLGIFIMMGLVFVMTLFSMIFAAFAPNLYELLNAAMGILLFATPLFWHPGDRTGVRGLLSTYNPFSHMLAIVREPALGRVPDSISILVCLGMTIVIGVVGVYLFRISRPWIIFRL